MVLLIYPPVTKACEPAAGLARLAGALRRRGVSCRVFDANLGGQIALLSDAARMVSGDRRSVRAARHAPDHLALLRRPAGYGHRDRYGRAVADLQHLLSLAGGEDGCRPGLANYVDERLSPLRSDDLLRMAEHPERHAFFPYFREELSRRLAEKTPSLIGISLNHLGQALGAFSLVGHLKRVLPGTPVLLGGGLVTSWLARPDGRNPFSGLVDEMVAGPGENTLLARLGRAPEEGFACPDYGDVPAADLLSPGFILPYSTSGGCWWGRCTFCPERAEGNPYRPVPDRQVMEDLRRLTDAHRPVLIHFLDNALRPGLLRSIAVSPPGVPWYGFVRVGPELADPDFCAALRRSGCVLLQVGIESGSRRVLDAMDKGIEPEGIARALRAMRGAGIAVYAYLLFGAPAEAEADARETLAFTVRHREEIAFLNAALFSLPAYGPDAERLSTSAFSEGDLSLYRDFVHPAGWHRARVRRFLDREFTRHPAVAEILRRNPPVFTSNHAPLFVLSGAYRGASPV